MGLFPKNRDDRVWVSNAASLLYTLPENKTPSRDFSHTGCGGSRQKMERKFLVLLRRFRLLKEQSYFNIFVCSFLRLHGETRRFLSAFGGSSKLCGFGNGQWKLKEYGLCEAQTNLYVLDPPSRSRTNPRRF